MIDYGKRKGNTQHGSFPGGGEGPGAADRVAVCGQVVGRGCDYLEGGGGEVMPITWPCPFAIYNGKRAERQPRVVGRGQVVERKAKYKKEEGD